MVKMGHGELSAGCASCLPASSVGDIEVNTSFEASVTAVDRTSSSPHNDWTSTC